MYYIWRSVGTIPPYTWTYIHMYNTYMPPPPPPPATYLPIGTRIIFTHKYIFIRVPSIVTCSPPVQESEPVLSRPSLLVLASHPPPPPPPPPPPKKNFYLLSMNLPDFILHLEELWHIPDRAIEHDWFYMYSAPSCLGVCMKPGIWRAFNKVQELPPPTRVYKLFSPSFDAL